MSKETYYSKNKECILAKTKTPEAKKRRKEWMRAWRRTKKGSSYEKTYAQSPTFKKAQKKWRESNRDKGRASSKRYREAHPEEIKARKRAYYLAKKGASPSGAGASEVE